MARNCFTLKQVYQFLDARPAQPSIVWMEKDLSTGNQKEVYRSFGGWLSPDGRYLVVAGAPDKPGPLTVRSITGGEIRELGARGRFVDASWEGDSIYMIRASGELWRFPIDGSEPRKVDLKLEGNKLKIGPFRVHPDGKRIAFEMRPAAKQDEVWMLENFLPTTSPTK